VIDRNSILLPFSTSIFHAFLSEAGINANNYINTVTLSALRYTYHATNLPVFLSFFFSLSHVSKTDIATVTQMVRSTLIIIWHLSQTICL